MRKQILWKQLAALGLAGVLAFSSPASAAAVETGTETQADISETEAFEAGTETAEETQTEAVVEETVQTDTKTEDSASPANPVHNYTGETDGEDYTDWSYIYFGSYPQSEVTGDDGKYHRSDL